MSRRSHRSRQAPCHDPAPAYAYSRHLIWNRTGHRALYEAKGLGPAAGNGWYTADKKRAGVRHDGTPCAAALRLHIPAKHGYTDTTQTFWAASWSGPQVSPLDEFIRTRITEPLGMKDTRFFLPAAERDRLPSSMRATATIESFERLRALKDKDTTSKVRGEVFQVAPDCCRRPATTPASWR